MNPTLAQALAVVAPVIVALLTKAQASDRLRALISLGLVALLVLGTYLGDAYPDEFDNLVALTGQLVAITIASYKVVDTALGEDTKLNDLVLPRFGAG